MLRAAVQLHHFDALPAHCHHAVCVLRFTSALPGARWRAVLRALAAADVIERDDDDEGVGDGEPSAFVAAPYVPRTADTHTAAIAQLQAIPEIEAGWLFTVGTTVDAIAAEADREHSDDDSDDDSGNSDDDTSHWRHGPPPQAEHASFVVDNYPDILEEFDGEGFGIALKLAGPQVAGEAAVAAALHHVWISSYVDRRVDEVPFRRAAMTFDEAHRAALLWVDQFGPPATITEMVHHLLWIAERIHEITPVAHARFAPATEAQQYAALADDGGPAFVLAGNPLRAQFHEHGESEALAWAQSQSLWSLAELAAMLVELGTDFDPDEPEGGATAARLFDRANDLDPSNDDARSYALVALVRSGRVDAALERALASHEPTLRGYTFGLLAEHATERLADALPLLDAATLDGIAEERVGEILAAVAERVPQAIPDLLVKLPRTTATVAHVYNASFKCEDDALRLAVLEHVMALPEPGTDENHHRHAYTFAFNNACVLAHAMKDYPKALAIAEAAQRWAEENPYIFHGAACAYAAVGEFDKAMHQVERAVARDYDHLDKLEQDTDLGELRNWPRFIELFAERRARLARAEPVREITADAFEGAVLGASVPVLVDFTASWCGPCRRQAPILDRLAQSADGNYRIVKVDIDACPELAERYDATSVPTLVVFHRGHEVARTVGLSQRDELQALLAQARDDA